MQSIYVLIVMLSLLCSGLVAQDKPSYVLDSVTFTSHLLKKEKAYTIYLPKGYESSQSTYYPVLYLLHGAWGNQASWLKDGRMKTITDSLIDLGKITPMIIVMPDAEMTWYMNSPTGKYPFEDFFIQELIPHIQKKYRCNSTKQYRAIAGLSMGGFGALLYTLHHPEMFNACVALSAAIRTDEQIDSMPQDEFDKRYKQVLGTTKSTDPRITDFWHHNSVLYLMERWREGEGKSVRIYMDIGDDDYLYKGNSLLHIMMRDHRIPHEYRVRDGGHTWDYWQSGLAAVLNFVSLSFE